MEVQQCVSLARYIFIELFSGVIFSLSFFLCTKLLLSYVLKTKQNKKPEFAASCCTCSVRLGEDTCFPPSLLASVLILLMITHRYRADLHVLLYLVCVCVCACGGSKRWRALWWLFVIDLIMENSPWHCSWRVHGLWHLHEKYSRGASFCHKTPVDKAQPWQGAKKERDAVKKERKGYIMTKRR